MDTYQPLAKKVIGNLNVIAEMRVEVTNMRNEFRTKMFTFEQDIKPLSKIEWVKEELLKNKIELKQEIMTQKRLLNHQGKSLNKIVNENDYPLKIKQLLDEIRGHKEKMRQMELKAIQDQRMIF